MTGSATPTLSQLLKASFDNNIKNVYTAYPGTVTEYNPNILQASVSLDLQEVVDGRETNIPVLNNVPVLFPRAKNAHVVFPIEVGSKGLVIFSQRSIDGWIELGKSLVPEDPRMHNINDGVFIPGLSPKNDVLTRKGSPDSVEVTNGETYIELMKGGGVRINATDTIKLDDGTAFFEISNGKFKLEAANVELINQISEVIKILDQVLDGLSIAMVATVAGPMPLTNAAQFVTLKTMLLQISEKINTLKA